MTSGCCADQSEASHQQQLDWNRKLEAAHQSGVDEDAHENEQHDGCARNAQRDEVGLRERGEELPVSLRRRRKTEPSK